jgi:hypothetical protein
VEKIINIIFSSALFHRQMITFWKNTRPEPSDHDPEDHSIRLTCFHFLQLTLCHYYIDVWNLVPCITAISLLTSVAR